MKYEEMRQMEGSHCCAQCEGLLVTRWLVDFNAYELVCGQDKSHVGFKPIPSVSQVIARGDADKLLGKGAQKDLEKMAERGVTALSRLPDKDVASGEPIARDKMLALIDWGTRLTLKPYLGHVCLYFGKPYITIDGYYYLLAKSNYNGAISTRPLTPEERQSYGISEGDIAWLAEAWKMMVKLPPTGLGIVTKEEIEGKSTRQPEQFRAPVVHAHPQRMAEKRAEWQLLRKLIPLDDER